VGLFTNKFALAGAGAMILLQVFFTYSPVMNRLFQSVPLEAATWWGIAGVAVFSFIAVEIEKHLRFRRRNQVPE
jgi:magnesium-transporting ATPase (P-type)